MARSRSRARPRARALRPGRGHGTPQRQGATVIAHDTNADLDVSRGRRDIHARRLGRRAPRRRRPRRQEPGIPGQAPPVDGRARPRHPRHLGDRARGAAAREPDHRDHGDERQDDDDGAARGDVRRGRGAGRGGGQHRPAADEPRRHDVAGRVGRVRALLVPARGRRDAPLPDRGAPQPRAGSPRSPRHRSRRIATRSSASSSSRPRTTSRSSRAASAPCRARRGGSSSTAATSCRPSR